MKDVERTVFDIIAEKAKIDPGTLSRDTELTSLSIDSVDILEVIFELEEAFDITLEFNANRGAGLPGLATVGEVVDLVRKQIEAGGSEASP